MRLGHDAPLAAWMLRSRPWKLLDHLSHFLNADRARTYMRHGADIAAVPNVGLVCDGEDDEGNSIQRPGPSYHRDLLFSNGAYAEEEAEELDEQDAEELTVVCSSVLRRSLALFRSPSAPAPADEVQQLVARAAEPWSPETHELFPNGARATATLLRHVGRKMRDHGPAWQQLPVEVWERGIVSAAVTRMCKLASAE